MSNTTRYQKSAPALNRSDLLSIASLVDTLTGDSDETELEILHIIHGVVINFNDLIDVEMDFDDRVDFAMDLTCVDLFSKGFVHKKWQRTAAMATVKNLFRDARSITQMRTTRSRVLCELNRKIATRKLEFEKLQLAGNNRKPRPALREVHYEPLNTQQSSKPSQKQRPRKRSNNGAVQRRKAA